jgi:hypothetical protein
MRFPDLHATTECLSLLALSLSSTFCFAQFTETPIPAPQAILNQYFGQQPGCSCYIPSALQYPKTKNYFPDYLLDNIVVSPSSVVTTVGQQVQIQFDASAICMGQSFKDQHGVAYPNNGPIGTVQWEAGSVQDLKNFSAVVTFTGYQQAKADNIVVSLNPQCWDTGAKCTTPNHVTQCNASVTIPVTVLAANATQAEIEDHQQHPNDAWFKPEYRPKRQNKVIKQKSTTAPGAGAAAKN